MKKKELAAVRLHTGQATEEEAQIAIRTAGWSVLLALRDLGGELLDNPTFYAEIASACGVGTPEGFSDILNALIEQDWVSRLEMSEGPTLFLTQKGREQADKVEEWLGQAQALCGAKKDAEQRRLNAET